MALRERIIMRGVGSTVRFGNAEIGQHKGGCLGLHGRTAIGMERELPRHDAMLCDAVFERWFEKARSLCVGDMPSNHPPAKYINDHIEIEVGPFRGPHQL